MSANLGQLKALVVDDNAHMRILLKSLLLALGVGRVYDSADGRSAFVELKAHKPDIVLTDLSMKPVDGIEFTRMVRTGADSPNRSVPIIMVTGHTERQRVEAARDAGVTEFVAKPITIQTLRSKLAEITEKPRPFVKCHTYFGPDRRRRRTEDYAGPWRRSDDPQNIVAIETV